MPALFKTPAEWSKPVGGIKYETTADIDWGLGNAGSNLRLKIPAGRIFDVSIPTWLRWFLNPHAPEFRLAGLIHDHLLHEENWTRIRAGGEFHDALRAGGTSAFVAVAMWVAVSLFRYPLRHQ